MNDCSSEYWLDYDECPRPVTVIYRPGTNHGLHLVLTLLTCGLWFPIWLIDALVNPPRTIVIDSDGRVTRRR
jgi:hypothetical protein